MDNTGALQDHLDYDAYGNVTESNKAFGDRYKFTAREYDYDTGLQYNLGRYYMPAAGRWLNEDPWGFGAGDANLYRYVGNDPANGVDPSGLADTSKGGTTNPPDPSTLDSKQLRGYVESGLMSLKNRIATGELGKGLPPGELKRIQAYLDELSRGINWETSREQLLDILNQATQINLDHPGIACSDA
jgi:RHS repeat-associated protein